MKRKVYCYDFDGTITRKDTFLEFIKYTKGTSRFLQGFLLYSPLLILMKLHLYPNYKVKQKVFSYFFHGESIDAFNHQCRSFARDCADLLRESAKTSLRKAIAEDATIFIVSASIDNWVVPFFKDSVVSDFNPTDLHILGTQIEVVDNKITGRFLSRNCYGQEKVNRIQQMLTAPRDEYHIIAYGDSRGDQEMLAYANQGYYKPFRR